MEKIIRLLTIFMLSPLLGFSQTDDLCSTEFYASRAEFDSVIYSIVEIDTVQLEGSVIISYDQYHKFFTTKINRFTPFIKANYLEYFDNNVSPVINGEKVLDTAFYVFRTHSYKEYISFESLFSLGFASDIANQQFLYSNYNYSYAYKYRNKLFGKNYLFSINYLRGQFIRIKVPSCIIDFVILPRMNTYVDLNKDYYYYYILLNTNDLVYDNIDVKSLNLSFGRWWNSSSLKYKKVR